MIGKNDVENAFADFIKSCDNYIRDISELYDISELIGNVKEVTRAIIYNDKYVKKGHPLELDFNGKYSERNLFIYSPKIAVNGTFFDDNEENRAIEKYDLAKSKDDTVDNHGIPNKYKGDFLEDILIEDVIISNYGHLDVKQYSINLYRIIKLYNDDFVSHICSKNIYKLNMFNEYTCLIEIPEFNSVIEQINNRIKDRSNILTIPLEKKDEKLVWLGKPSQLGFIINKLVENGYVKEMNFSKLSKICLESFEIDTTKGNLENELNPNKNSLSEKKLNWFKIPHINDLV